jgi:hypothetical protein
VTLATWSPDLPFCALILFMIFLMFVPEMIEGVRKYRAGRELARQLYRESNKPRLFDQDRDVWK